MTNYNDLTQEQKESITKELRDLFEEREKIKDYSIEFIRGYKIDDKIKGFQEGLKTSIKIIDEEIKFLKDLGLVKIKEQEPIEFETIYNNDTYYLVENRIKELKKQREQLQFEVELE